MKTLTVTELRSQSKRFILDYDESAESTPYDVYDSGRHTSFDGLSIIQEFESMSIKDQQGHAFTMLQCQSCLTNDKEVITNLVPTHDMPLLAPKAICDAKTLPWILANLRDRLHDDQLVVVMNDFFDLATSDVANQLSRFRLGKDVGEYRFCPM
ncbi:unnamed protein product [Calypogeia fissa]